MKKTLLLGVAALSAASVWAAEPFILNDVQVQAISPDGSIIVSEWYGTVSLYNANDGSLINSFGDEEFAYSIGLGNCIATDGTLVGAVPMGAAYLKGSEWIELDLPETVFGSYAHGITPDGSVIVGNVGTAPISTDDTETPMMVPAIWERQADGTYSAIRMLPYPEHDFTGRVPQYVTALAVSDDGNTVFGQVQDFTGAMATLIVYTRKADDSWEYRVANNLVNPDNLTFPEWPGDGPQYVDPESFLTEDELEEYYDAVQNYDWDSEDPYPLPTDFMTEEELAAYEAAQAKFEEENAIYMEKYEAFMQVYQECLDKGQPSLYNNVKLSRGGKTVVTTTVIVEDDPDSWMGFKETYFPMLVNIDSFDYSLKNSDNIIVSCACADGTILGFKEEVGKWREAVIYPDGSDDFVSMYDFFTTRNPESAAWIKENMFRDIEMYDFSSGGFVTMNDAAFTGTPFATPDLTVFATAVAQIWDPEDMTNVLTYVFAGVPAGVKDVAADAAELGVKVLKGGRIAIEGNATMVTVYDMNGLKVYSGVPTGTVVETGLVSGAYIVKVASADDTKVVKAVF